MPNGVVFIGAGNKLIGSPNKWITVKRNNKNKTVFKTNPPVSPPKQAPKRPVWLEKPSKKNVPRLRAKKMTRTVEIRSKATIRKIAETESISLPTRLSEKPVSAVFLIVALDLVSTVRVVFFARRRGTFFLDSFSSQTGLFDACFGGDTGGIFLDTVLLFLFLFTMIHSLGLPISSSPAPANTTARARPI